MWFEAKVEDSVFARRRVLRARWHQRPRTQNRPPGAGLLAAGAELGSRVRRKPRRLDHQAEASLVAGRKPTAAVPPLAAAAVEKEAAGAEVGSRT